MNVPIIEITNYAEDSAESGDQDETFYSAVGSPARTRSPAARRRSRSVRDLGGSPVLLVRPHGRRQGRDPQVREDPARRPALRRRMGDEDCWAPGNVFKARPVPEGSAAPHTSQRPAPRPPTIPKTPNFSAAGRAALHKIRQGRRP